MTGPAGHVALCRSYNVAQIFMLEHKTCPRLLSVQARRRPSSVHTDCGMCKGGIPLPRGQEEVRKCGIGQKSEKTTPQPVGVPVYKVLYCILHPNML